MPREPTPGSSEAGSAAFRVVQSHCLLKMGQGLRQLSEIKQYRSDTIVNRLKEFQGQAASGHGQEPL